MDGEKGEGGGGMEVGGEKVAGGGGGEGMEVGEENYIPVAALSPPE